MKHPLKHYVEYASVRLLAAALCALPYRGALGLGCGLAWIAFHVYGYRVREARRRIIEIFGSRYTPRQAGRIAWVSWRNFIFTMVETLRLPVARPAWTLSVVDTAGTHAKIKNWSDTGKGAIIATAHMGSWEMAVLYCVAVKIPLFSLAAQQKNTLVDDFFNRARAGTGYETVLRSSSILKTILRKIREGKVLAILSDVRGKTDALPIRFLGKTANVAEGMGFIARQAGVPVFPVMITRQGWTKHVYRVCDPVFPDPGADKRNDALRITQAFFDILSEKVNNEPEQWFWFNKRWIFDPLPAPGPDSGLRQTAAVTQAAAEKSEE